MVLGDLTCKGADVRRRCTTGPWARPDEARGCHVMGPRTHSTHSFSLDQPLAGLATHHPLSRPLSHPGAFLPSGPGAY